jgi:hypothetical protein
MPYRFDRAQSPGSKCRMCKSPIPLGGFRLGICSTYKNHESCCWRCFPQCMTRVIAEHVLADIRCNEPVHINASGEEAAHFLDTLEEMTQPAYQFRIKRKLRASSSSSSAVLELKDSSPPPAVSDAEARKRQRPSINQVDWMHHLTTGTLGSVTVDVLKEYLRANSQAVSGTKAELVARVGDHLSRMLPLTPFLGFQGFLQSAGAGANPPGLFYLDHHLGRDSLTRTMPTGFKMKI